MKIYNYTGLCEWDSYVCPVSMSTHYDLQGIWEAYLGMDGANVEEVAAAADDLFEAYTTDGYSWNADIEGILLPLAVPDELCQRLAELARKRLADIEMRVFRVIAGTHGWEEVARSHPENQPTAASA